MKKFILTTLSFICLTPLFAQESASGGLQTIHSNILCTAPNSDVACASSEEKTMIYFDGQSLRVVRADGSVVGYGALTMVEKEGTKGETSTTVATASYTSTDIVTSVDHQIKITTYSSEVWPSFEDKEYNRVVEIIDGSTGAISTFYGLKTDKK